MAKQPDLLKAKLELKLPNRNEPRLWVRRLAIWESAAKPPIRDIALHPGLNVVWSPDGAADADGDAIGHGSGKTLFCRLLRYCLGEDRFADDDLRDKIATKFPDGYVGAEVVLDGTTWAVLRPLGSRRRQSAVPNKALKEVSVASAPGTGIEPLLSAIEDAIITPTTRDLIACSQDRGTAWRIALAWMSRDQEARLSKVLAWRDSASSSNSPATTMTELQRLNAGRAFLRAITAEELELAAELAALSQKAAQEDRTIGHCKWTIERSEQHLSVPTKLPKHDAMGPLGEASAPAGKAPHLKLVASNPDIDAEEALAANRIGYREAADEFARLKGEVGRLDGLLEEIPKRISMLKGEGVGLQYAKYEAEHFICPICDVPVDRVLAEGCKLSHRLPDLEACKKRWEENKAQLARESEALTATKVQREREAFALLRAEAVFKRREAELSSAEASQRQRLKADQEQVALDTRNSLIAELKKEKQRAETAFEKLNTEKKGASDRLAAMRQLQNRRLQRLRDLFNAIIRITVSDDARGDVKLKSDALDLALDLQGDRRGAAMGISKILAFDIAALCVAAEEAADLPAFVIHDSPREADLGLPIYHGLFELMHRIHKASEAPLFQYIITTTTPPPAQYQGAPWCVLKLRGAPATERLLRIDL